MLGLGLSLEYNISSLSLPAPVILTNPQVTGNPVVGSILNTTNGTWTNSPTLFTYQWYRGVTPIGTNSSSYTLTQNDAGNTSDIKCVVTASNGLSTNASSNIINRILDTDTNSYISGLSLTTVEINAYNNFFISMRTNGYNNQIDRLHVYAGATQAASNKSLYGNFVAVPVNSPTWTRKIGYTNTGTSYIKTSWIPLTNGSNFKRNDHLVQVYVDRATTTNVLLTGCFDGGTKSHYINWKNTGGIDVSDYGSVVSDVYTGTTTSNKLFAVQRTSNTNINIFRDSSSTSVSNTTVDNLQSIEWYDSGRNLSGSVQLPLGNGDKLIYGCNGSSLVSPTVLNTLIQNLIIAL